MRVLGFGTYDVARHPRAGIVLDGLRAHGDDVVEVNERLGFSTIERVAMLGRPWLAYRFVLQLLRSWAALAFRSLRARRGGRFDAVFVGYLGHFDVVLARLLYPRTCIVLDLMIFAADTARDRGVSGRLKLRLLDALDRIAVLCAGVVVVDTAEHFMLLRPRSRRKAVVVPVGASASWFVGSPGKPDAERKFRVVFFGMYTPLQGTAVIGEALCLLADRDDIQISMIGTGPDYEATRAAAAANTSVTWTDWLDADQLPGIVANHDVCLGIFGTSPKALRVVPNKVYEGAAAGCVIVTSDTAPQRRALDGVAVFVPAGEPKALAAALTVLADNRAEVARRAAQARAAADAMFTASEIVKPLRERLMSAMTSANEESP